MERFLADLEKRRLGIIYDDLLADKRAIVIAVAQDIKAENVNEMLNLSHGMIFVAVSAERSQALLLKQMKRPALLSSCEQKGFESNNVDVCMSVEARQGVTTGISAADRAATIAVLAEAEPNPRALVSPGHVFPVKVCAGGVLARCALPEAAVDVVTLQGYTAAAAYSDLLNSSGEFLEIERLFELASLNRLPIIALSELIRYRLRRDLLIKRMAEAQLPTEAGGLFKSVVYRCELHDSEHLALVKGQFDPNCVVLVRVQTDHPIGDVFGDPTLETRNSIRQSLAKIQERSKGILIYLRRSSSCGISDNYFAARGGDQGSYQLMRNCGLGAQILRDLGVSKVELLYNHQRILLGLQSFGIEVVKQQRLID